MRERIKRGVNPVLPPRGSAGGQPDPLSAESGPEGAADIARLLNSSVRDPSIRMTDEGRRLLRWLNLHVVDDADCTDLIATVPDRSARIVAELAAGCAQKWSRIHAELDKRSLT